MNSSAKDTSVTRPGARCSTCRAPSAVGWDTIFSPFDVQDTAPAYRLECTVIHPNVLWIICGFKIRQVINYNWSQNHFTLGQNKSKSLFHSVEHFRPRCFMVGWWSITHTWLEMNIPTLAYFLLLTRNDVWPIRSCTKPPRHISVTQPMHDCNSVFFYQVRVRQYFIKQSAITTTLTCSVYRKDCPVYNKRNEIPLMLIWVANDMEFYHL